MLLLVFTLSFVAVNNTFLAFIYTLLQSVVYSNTVMLLLVFILSFAAANNNANNAFASIYTLLRSDYYLLP